MLLRCPQATGYGAGSALSGLPHRTDPVDDVSHYAYAAADCLVSATGFDWRTISYCWGLASS